MTAISLSCWSESDQKAIREQLVRILNSGPFHHLRHSATASGSWSTPQSIEELWTGRVYRPRGIRGTACWHPPCCKRVPIATPCEHHPRAWSPKEPRKVPALFERDPASALMTCLVNSTKRYLSKPGIPYPFQLDRALLTGSGRTSTFAACFRSPRPISRRKAHTPGL